MGRGPGRLQRAVLFVLAHDNPEPMRRRRQAVLPEDDVQPDEWTTEGVCSALSGCSCEALAAKELGVTPVEPIKHAVRDELGEHGWWWDETFTRQVRRALDRLHAVGRVEKRLLPNRRYEVRRGSFGSEERYRAYRERYPQPTVALWRLNGGPVSGRVAGASVKAVGGSVNSPP